MAEENKSKNPGRVAWGKKLAQMTKELKEKKKQGAREEVKLIKKDISIDKQTENKLNSHHIEVMMAVGGLLVAVIALYLQYKNANSRINTNQVNNNQQVNTDQVKTNQIGQQCKFPHFEYF